MRLKASELKAARLFKRTVTTKMLELPIRMQYAQANTWRYALKKSLVSLSVLVLFASISFAKTSSAKQVGPKGSDCESFDDCEHPPYVGPDGVPYDENGNPIDEDEGGGHFEESPEDGDSGYLESGI